MQLGRSMAQELKIKGSGAALTPDFNEGYAHSPEQEQPMSHQPPPIGGFPLPPALPQSASSQSFQALPPEPHAGDGVQEPARRVARRRPAGPARPNMAANDDVPSIGGLIFALEQKPSNKPFTYAAVFSVAWGIIGIGMAAFNMWTEMAKGISFGALFASPITFLTLTAIALPIGVIWFLALLAWRADELRLRSSTMTEVAVRLAEPDRMAEQSIVSLGQNVRRQVSFMNDAVSRALGRAGELEAMVHGEVAALERSYEENEKRIRGLIQELSGERHALLNTSERVAITLRTLGSEVPGLIDKLSEQQIKLSDIIAGAGHNLTSLETALAQSAGQLETSLGSRTQHLQNVLEDYSTRIDVTMGERSDALQKQLTTGSANLERHLTERAEQMQTVLEGYTGALAAALSTRTDEMQIAFDESLRTLDTSLGNRTDNLQAVFEEYARALDTTLANRAVALDVQLVERTSALDHAFSQRLQLFDDSIQRSALAIDGAVQERSIALNAALDNHAKSFRETIGRQAGEIDESLMQGISAVRRSSENITRQSLKAIEGLAGQSDLLKNVSENLLSQVQSVTNRFEGQGQQIMKAANALETANYKIDTTLQTRHAELNRTLEKISGSADDFGKVINTYSSAIEGTLTDAEKRARVAADEMRAGAEYRSRAANAEMEQLRSQTTQYIEQMRSQTVSEGDRALDEVKRRFANASGEVQQQVGSLTELVSGATLEVRNRSAFASAELAREQALLKAQLETMPSAARESAETMRRSLQDQLQALDQLNQITNRGAQLRDVTPPISPPQQSGYMAQSTPQAAPIHLAPAQPSYAPVAVPPAPTDVRSPEMQRALSSLSTVAHHEQPGARKRGPNGGDPNWSFGDLLARASQVDEATLAQPQSAPFSLNVAAIARALDQAAADAIWSRLRTGQRGVMARSIYSPEGKVAFDEVSRRVKTDPDLQATISRYLADFERILKDSESRDPSGRQLQGHLVSDMGRVYLFLAHASGRLA
jgi:hypothetical protein